MHKEEQRPVCFTLVVLAVFFFGWSTSQTNRTGYDRHADIIISSLFFAHFCPILILAQAMLQHGKKKKKKQELNKDSLSTSKTFGFQLLVVPFKAIILKMFMQQKHFSYT